jgi:hypothetical protein
MRAVVRGLDVALGVVAVVLFLRLVLEVSVGPYSLIAAVFQAFTDPLLSPFAGMSSTVVLDGGHATTATVMLAFVVYGAAYVMIDRVLRAVPRHSP